MFSQKLEPIDTCVNKGMGDFSYSQKSPIPIKNILRNQYRKDTVSLYQQIQSPFRSQFMRSFLIDFPDDKATTYTQ